MQPVKCLNCSWGYSYDTFSLTPPSCRTWFPFRYLDVENNCQYTRKEYWENERNWGCQVLEVFIKKGKNRNTHAVTFYGCYLPLHDTILFWLSFASIFWVHSNIFSVAKKRKTSAVIFPAARTMGMIHGPRFHYIFPFLMKYQITSNSNTVITTKSIKIPGVHLNG